MTGTAIPADGAFKDALRKVTEPEPKCSLFQAMKAIGPENTKDLKMSLWESSDVFSASQISRALKLLGQDVSDSSIRRCRRNKCDCWMK